MYKLDTLLMFRNLILGIKINHIFLRHHLQAAHKCGCHFVPIFLLFLVAKLRKTQKLLG